LPQHEVSQGTRYPSGKELNSLLVVCRVTVEFDAFQINHADDLVIEHDRNGEF
jgi:hypothetical protein